MKTVIYAILLSFFPSFIRIPLLRRRGARIGVGCRIGFFTVIDCAEIEIGDCVQIASFNLIHRLVSLKMGSGSRMNGFNWITGARTGSLVVGENAAITRLHFFECSGDIHLGPNSIIAGRGSHFFTHGISSQKLEDIRPIKIGSWCYVGSSSRFVPGSGVSRGTFVGMGSVVSRLHSDEYVLLAGNPARVRKHLAPDDIYFDRPFMPHDHHPENYTGA